MDKDTFSFNNQIYSNNNNILLEIIDDLQQIVDSSQDNLMIKRIGDIIIKMNSLINENKKNMELIMNQYSKLENKMNQLLNQKSDINNHQELKYKNGRYVGQVVNGLREGKGIEYYNNGNRYEGDFRNDKREGNGIYYYNNGEREMGDYCNDKQIGKHVKLNKNGDVKINNF